MVQRSIDVCQLTSSYLNSILQVCGRNFTAELSLTISISTRSSRYEMQSSTLNRILLDLSFLSSPTLSARSDVSQQSLAVIFQIRTF